MGSNIWKHCNVLAFLFASFFSSNSLKHSIGFRRVTIASAFAIVLFVAGLVAVPYSITDSSNAATNASGDTSISIAPSSGLIEVSLSATANDGLGTGTAQVTVATTVGSGYTLTMNTKTTDNALTNKKDSTQKINSITTDTTKSNLSTNTWGYSLDDFTYKKVPTTSSTDADRTIAKTSSASTNNYDVSFAARVGQDTQPGVYINTVIFSATGNIPEHTINYNVNGGSGTFNPTKGYAYSLIIDPNAIPTPPTGKGFAGWATSSSASTATYHPGDTYNFPSGTTSVTLYAVYGKLYTWEKYNVTSSQVTTYFEKKSSFTSTKSISQSNARTSTYGTSYTFDSTTGKYTVNQNTTPSSASCSGIGSTKYYYITLPSTSGSQTGTTMYQLDSGSGTSTCSLKYYTYTTTSSQQTIYKKGSTSYGTVTSTDPDAYPEDGTPDNTYWYIRTDHKRTLSDISSMQEMTSEICSASAENETATLTDTRDNKTYTIVKLGSPINKCWMQQNLRLGKSTTMTLTPDDTNITKNYTLPAAQTSGTTSWSSATTGKVYATNNTSYGNYYNWYAATAGTGTSSMSSGNASGSICPKGWRLPTGGSSGEFRTLNTTYNSGSTSSDSGLLADPLKLVRAGYYYSGVTNQDSNGFYWSSTVNLSSYAYSLNFGSSDVNPARSNYKYFGCSLRCLSAS